MNKQVALLALRVILVLRNRKTTIYHTVHPYKINTFSDKKYSVMHVVYYHVLKS